MGVERPMMGCSEVDSEEESTVTPLEDSMSVDVTLRRGLESVVGGTCAGFEAASTSTLDKTECAPVDVAWVSCGVIGKLCRRLARVPLLCESIMFSWDSSGVIGILLSIVR